MKLVILTIKTAGNIFLVNRLAEEFDIQGMVILTFKPKTRKEKWQFWWKQMKRYGAYTTINRYLYLKLPKTDENSEAVEKDYFNPNDERNEYRFDGNVMLTEEINSDPVAQFIKNLSPDVIAVCGSSVLKPKIFSLAPKGAVNIHCGITPEYRSAHPVEWAIFNRDFDNVGVTIHFVNAGVDTGDVIYQKRVTVQRGDTIPSLYAKDIREGAELMVKAIKDIAQGTVRPVPQQRNAGKHYLSFEYGYLQNRKVRRILESL
jgi:methionyl-tRNA formyltransferase